MEIAVNSRPLSNVEEEVQQPLLTPNSFLFQRSTQLPELETNHLKDAASEQDICKGVNKPCGLGGQVVSARVERASQDETH